MARILLSIFLLGLAGCEPLAIALVGAGAGTALRYNIDGVTSRTFTAPAAEVKNASLAALERMGLAFESLEMFEHGELLYARTENRAIEIGRASCREKCSKQCRSRWSPYH